MNRLRRPTGKPPAKADPDADIPDSGLRPALLNSAVEVIELALGFAYPADNVLSHYFRENKTGSRDRAFIAELAYAVLRRKRSLERSAKLHSSSISMTRQIALLALVRVIGYSLRQIEPLLRKNEHEWLKEVALQREADAEGETLGDKLDLPDWLAERLSAQMSPKQLTDLVHSLNTSAPLDLRVNTIKGEREAVLAKLNADGIEAMACTYSPVGIRLRHKPALNKHTLFIKGVIEVQDEGSQLLPLLLAARRGEMVTDFCAGAGGKTLQIGAMMRNTGRLYAFDVAEKRLAKLKPRLARSGLSNVHPVAIDSENDQRVRRLAGKMDRVLVDAPCSGLGTLRRNPDLKWRQTPQAVAELVLKQTAILAAAAKMVKPGGRVVYATCSILAEENEGIVGAFLAAHPEFSVLAADEVLKTKGVVVAPNREDGYLRLSPQEHGCDGFFAAVLQRQAV
ncbi:MAG: RsmB/NOP family class I SAM-dependent RNA methyltransferase [Rhodocyclaceae bacterium]|nr:RsmB/NOP family class I SAM-dependent RNA methyltransferase [Rhodocyclaceae bacterium]MBK6907438.1 RsmB/NOP family class I SAM-dependent RNA methyltransferase [Rhodocyclaceae bacterium]